LNLLQTSTRRDIGKEKQHQEEKKKTMDGRKENALRALTYSRVTAGLVVGHNIWNLNNPDFHALMEEKNSKKIEQVDKSISKKYDRDVKVYNSGLLEMEKARHHYAAVQEGGVLYGITNTKDRSKIINNLRKAKHWLLSENYGSLIRYKQLCMVTRSKIPSKIDQRQLVWDSTYFALPHPSLPVKPTNYIETGGENDDGDNYYSFVCN
jgi:thymidylate synthase ThyX